MLANIKGIAPSSVVGFLKTIIEQVQGKAGATGLASVIALALALYSASGYVGVHARLQCHL